MATGRHSIEATALIVLFYENAVAPLFSLLNNLSPRQLLNQPLSSLSCHKDSDPPTCTNAHMHTHKITR